MSLPLSALARVERTLAVICFAVAVKGIRAVVKNTPPQVSGLAGLRILSALPDPPAGPASTVGSAPP